MIGTLKDRCVTAGLSYDRGCMMTTYVKKSTQSAVGVTDYDDWLAIPLAENWAESKYHACSQRR